VVSSYADWRGVKTGVRGSAEGGGGAMRLALVNRKMWKGTKTLFFLSGVFS